MADRVVIRDHQPMPRGPVPPYLAVANALRERLDEGEWLPAEPLPSLAELAAQYNVSRGTARRAVGILRDEGRVTVAQGWGTFVAER
jgi:DNA-binding GntR family transcriptional regulator